LLLLVKLLQSLSPPGETDRPEMRIAARRDDVRKCKVEVPERRKRCPEVAGKLLERDLSVVIERAVSDR